MDETLEEMRRGGAIVVLSCAMAALVWLAPVSAYPNTTKGQLVAAALDAVILPLVEMVGKMPLLVALGLVAALGAGHALGLRFPRPSAPAFPPLPERPEPDEEIDVPVAPLARRRGLAAMAELHLHDPKAALPRKPGTVALEAQARAVLGDDFTLTDEIADRAMDLAAEWQRRGTPHGQHVDPVAIVRKRREKDRDWSADRSWLGGLPRLGGQAWPRGIDGVPLPFLAQLDLAEIAAANPDTPLPREGSLAFFINEGAVLYVPPGEHPQTPAPGDLPHAFREDSYPFPESPSQTTHPLFPFWPVEPIRMRVSTTEGDPEDIEQAQSEAIARLVPEREYAFSTGSKLTEGVEGADRMWWYGADLVLRQLQASLAHAPAAIAQREEWIAQAQAYQARLAASGEPAEDEIAKSRAGEERNRAAIAAIEQETHALATLISHMEAFVAGRDLWSEMGAEETELLGQVIAKARREHETLCRYEVCFGLREVRNATLRRMITGDQRAAAAIPDAVLALINEHYRLPTDWRHQMFGLGGCRQYARDDHMCDHLLLQIVYDDLPEFRFGDMGLYQFWISPENLAAGQWDKVELTFECG